MKTRKITASLLTVTLLVIICFVACSKKDSNPAPSTTTTSTTTPPPALCSNNLTATLDGNSYSATSFSNTFTAANFFQSSFVSVSSSDVTSHSIQLTIWSDIATGTYVITGTMPADTTGGASPTVGGSVGDLGSTLVQYLPTSGTITITRNDVAAKHIEGSFSFQAKQTTGTATHSVTNGSFCANY